MYGYGMFLSTNGIIASSGEAFDADAQAFFTAASITDLTQKNAVNQLVLDLKSNSLWTKMKALYPIVGGNATAHSYNLKNTAQYQLTFSSGWTHSSTGMTSNGAAYANTGLSPASALTTSNNSFGIYTRSSTTYNVDMGAGQPLGSARFFIYPNISGNTYMANGNYELVSDTNTNGFYINSKTQSNHISAYRNSTRIMNELSCTDLGTTSHNIYIGGYNNDGTAASFTAKQYALSFIADGLTATQASNLYTLVQTFQTTLSRQV